MDKILLIMLLLYLAIGAVFALSILSGVLARLPLNMRRPRHLYWATNVICFVRWTCAWFPIVMWSFIRPR
jgi:hypothetical protein